MPKVEIGGFLRCQVRKAKSGTLKSDTGWFPNLITNTGLGYYHNQPTFGAFDSRGAIVNIMSVGSGSAAPAVTDTALTTPVASVSAGTTGGGTGWAGFSSKGYTAAAGPNPAFWWGQISYLFATGAAAGNLTEIGACPGGVNPNGGLYSHALIVDSGGNPTTITVLSDEVLTVTYQVNYYINTTDTGFSFNLNGSPVTGIYRPLNIGTAPDLDGRLVGETPTVGLYNGAIGTVLSGPTGQLSVSQSSQYPGTYIDWVNNIAIDGTWYFDYTCTFPTGAGTGTINSLTFGLSMLQYQFGSLSTPIVKTSGQQLQISFRGAWGRH
jgi:hypothetical protein